MKMQPRDQIIDLFLQQMRAELGAHLKQVILFGSRARGDAAPDSDYDFLAVVDDATPLIVGQIDEVAGEMLFQHNAVLSVFPVSEKRFKAQTFLADQDVAVIESLVGDDKTANESEGES